ncbi:MAG: TIGR03621 family F420-dependent LLM class oxidoreductase [Acidimicrobiales bacterium]|jgi:probable F420-dependent oxidoreductase
MPQRFRFGYQVSTGTELNVVEAGRRVEAAGFDIFLVSDHVGPGRSPLPQLAAVAATTSTLRIGTFVLNSDMRNPVQLAWEATTLDHLSNGRFELGLGAGHTPHEYSQTGISLLRAAGRKAALLERVEILRRLLDGETVDWDGTHHQLTGAHIDRTVQEQLPILVGGNGDTLLRHAARHANIIGLQGLGKTLEDGHRHTMQWTTEYLDDQIDFIRAEASGREIELNALVQVVVITDDAQTAEDDLVERVDGLTREALRSLPYILIGTVDQIVAKLRTCRDRWGISYFVVRELDNFAPVIAACR